MRAGRLVSLMLLLQTRGRLTGEQVAAELEVSVRTVYRDIDALSEAGVPIYAERGPGGGIQLVDGYRTRLTGLTTQEAEALFLSGLPGPAAELGLGTVVAAARLKVLAALPPELRNRASRISQRFHLDAPGWFQSPESVAHLEALGAAVWESRAIDIDYRRDEVVARRRVEPLGLVLKGGIWYLVARTESNLRTYRVSRVQAVHPLEQHFERPADFDLAAFWTASISSYERGRPRYRVTIGLAAPDLDRVLDTVGNFVVEAAAGRPIADVEGRLRLDLEFDWLDTALGLLFELGSLADVVEPASMRTRMVEAARSVLARYDPPVQELDDERSPSALEAGPPRLA